MSLFKNQKFNVIIVGLFLMLLGGIAMPPSSAQAETLVNPETNLDTLTEKWLRYRAIRGCFSVIDVDSASYDEVMDGKWFNDGLSNYTASAGYVLSGSDDGKVRCEDGDFVKNTIVNVMGWKDGVDAWCSIQDVAKSDKGSDYAGCIKGDEFDMVDDGDEKARQASDFTDAKNALPDGKDYPYNPSDAMMYNVYRRSLEKFCGGGQSMADAGRTDDDLRSEQVVSVDYVNPSTGELEKSVHYDLDGKKEGDTIDGIYVADDLGQVNSKCYEMAERTRHYSGAYQKYVIKTLNEAIGDDMKSQINVTDAMKTDICGPRPPAGPGHQEEITWLPCVQGITTTIINAIDACVDDRSVQGAMDFPKRTDTIKKCVMKKLPAKYEPALANYQSPDLDDPTDKDAGGDGDATQCNIPKTGWILCPVLDTMGFIADQAFNFLSDNFLSVESSLFDDKSGTYTAWQQFRDLANIAFVIAILVVVYSQITGAGISNYGIKKLLPKIVIAAILVNLSYFICQLAVDISNILGYSLRDFFANLADKIPLPTGDVSSATSDTGGSPLGWVGIIAAVVVSATLVWLFLGALIPILLAALIAMFMILFILLARKALIVLLIALAPLAFVAYLLPNTEQWFKRWQKTFVQILMVFPVIALVFGASGLASKIVQASDDGVMMRIIAAGIATIPLFIVPGLLKRSIDAAGNVGAKLNGIGDKAGSLLGRRGKEAYDRSAVGQFKNFRSKRRDIRRAMIQGGTYEGRGGKFNPRNLQSKAFSGINSKTGDFGAHLANQGAQVAANLRIEEVKAANARIEEAVLNQDDLRQVAAGGAAKGINGGDMSSRIAAMQKMASTGDFEGMNKTWDHLRTNNDSDSTEDKEIRRAFADAVSSSGHAPGWMSQGALQEMREGTAADSTSLVEKSITNNTYSAERIAETHQDELKIVAQVNKDSSNVSIPAKQQLLNNAHAAQTDPQLARKMGKNAAAVDAVRTNNYVP